MTVTFNPSDCAADLLLSNGDLTVASTTTGGNGGCRANVSVSSGKLYFETTVTASSATGYDTIGVFTLTQSTASMYDANGGVGITTDGQIYVNGSNAGQPGFGETLVGQTVCIAVDLTNKLFWARIGNGPWNKSGSADPATGTGGIDISSVISGVNTAPGVSSSSSGTNAFEVTSNFGATAYVCNLPSGFTNWDGSTPTGPTYSSVTWDPQNKAPYIALSNSNLTAANTASGNWGAFATTKATTGKYYFEATASASGSTPYDTIGVISLAQVTNVMYTATGGVGICPANGAITLNGSTTGTSLGGSVVGNVISVAVDLTGKLAWFRSNGGNWNGSGTANPATGVGGIDISSVLGSVPAAPAMSSSSGSANGMVANAVFASGSWTYTAPSGFSEWPTPSGGGGSPTGTISTALTKASLAVSGYAQTYGTMTVTEGPDLADIFQGWAVHQPEATVSSWHHIYSDGNRLASSYASDGNGFITNVTVVLAGLSEFTPFYTAFNGADTGSGPYYTGTPTAGQTTFQWEFADLLCIDGLTFCSPGEGSTIDFGKWDFDASVDGVTWTNLTQFEWVISPTGFRDGVNPGGTVTFTNTLRYKYYRLICVTPASWAGRAWNTMNFRIPGTSAIEDNHSATPAISSGITTGAAAPLFDGNRYGGYPIADTGDVYNNAATSGQYFQFDFGAIHQVLLNKFRISINPFSESKDWGNWQWYGSVDGLTYTAIGSAFHFYPNGQSDPVFTVANDGNYYRFWQLRYVSGAVDTQIYELAEFFFDMTSIPASAMIAVEGPDVMFMHGYPGTYGEVVDFTPSEAKDVMSFSGYVPLSVILDANEGVDKFSAYAFQPLTGVFTVSEPPDTMAFVGLGRGENGTWTSSEALDIFTAIGIIPPSGLWSSSEAPDRFLALTPGVTIRRGRRQTFVA